MVRPTYRYPLHLLPGRSSLLLTLQAVAGTLYNVMNGLLDVEFDASLIQNDELLGRVAAYNAAQNDMRTGAPDKTYLLAQVIMTVSAARARPWNAGIWSAGIWIGADPSIYDARPLCCRVHGSCWCSSVQRNVRISHELKRPDRPHIG